MKRLWMKLIVIIVFMFLSFNYCCAEGFAAGTLVSIPVGYAKIENMCIGDCVVCYDADKNVVENRVVSIAKKSIDEYVCIAIAGEHCFVKGN